MKGFQSVVACIVAILFSCLGALGQGKDEVAAARTGFTAVKTGDDLHPLSPVSNSVTYSDNTKPSETSEEEWYEWKHHMGIPLKKKFTQLTRNFKVASCVRLSALASFRVSRDGRISQVRILDSSSNARFDSIVIDSINSLEGCGSLDFPKGTTKEFMDVVAPFDNMSGMRAPGLRWSSNMWDK